MTGLAAAPMSATGQRQTHSFAAETAGKELRESQLFLDDTWIEETYRMASRADSLADRVRRLPALEQAAIDPASRPARRPKCGTLGLSFC